MSVAKLLGQIKVFNDNVEREFKCPLSTADITIIQGMR